MIHCKLHSFFFVSAYICINVLSTRSCSFPAVSSRRRYYRWLRDRPPGSCTCWCCLRWVLQAVQSWTRQVATLRWLHWWSAVASSHAGHSVRFHFFWMSWEWSRWISLDGTTTLSWEWWWSTAASILSYTPPSIVISRRASERWWRRTAAVLQRQVEHTVDHHHISRTLCYTVNVIAVTCTSEMWLWLWGVTVPMQHWQIRLTNRTSSYYGRMTRLRLILQWHLCRTLMCRISTFTLFVCQIRKIQTTQLHSTVIVRTDRSCYVLHHTWLSATV